MPEVSTNPIVETAVKNAKESIKIHAGKFNGTFAGFALGLYNLLLGCGFDKKLAHKVGLDYMADWARGISADIELASKVAKFNKKDGTTKMAAPMKTAKMIGSNSMRVARVAQVIDGLFDEGTLDTRTFPESDSLPANVQEYLAKSEDWVKEQDWKE